MSYVLAINLQTNGQPPVGARHKPDTYLAQADEVVLSDAVYESQYNSGYVWDSATQTLRMSSAAEQLAVLKAVKRIQLVLAFDSEYDALWQVAGVEIGAIKDRILFKAAANRTAAENQKVTSAATLIDKIEAKLGAVSSATTEAEVEAITWTSTP